MGSIVAAPAGDASLSRDQLKKRVRADLDDVDLIRELLAERRVAADDEDRR